jgi:hypothetical protein
MDKITKKTISKNSTPNVNSKISWETIISTIGQSKALPVLLLRLQTLQNKGSKRTPQPIPASSLGPKTPQWKPNRKIIVVRDFMVSREARETICCALTYVEDWLDYEYPQDPIREKIAKMRRQLEYELDKKSRHR